MTAEIIGHALGGRRSGRDWLAKCPAHDDRSPSLSIAERDGRVLVYCHAGCRQLEVIDSLRARGLWPERERRDWTPAERRDWGQRRDDERRACFWAVAVRALAEPLLEGLSVAHPDRPRLAGLLRTIDGGGVVAEYLAWRAADPAMTAAMLRAGRESERRRQVALAAYVAEMEVRDAA